MAQPLSFDEFMQDRQQIPLQNKRLPSLLGTADNPQNEPAPDDVNSGVGALLGSLVGTGLAIPLAGAVSTRLPSAGAPLAETIIAGGAGVGSLTESIVRKFRNGEPLTLEEADFAEAKNEAALSAAFGFAGRGAVLGFQKGSRFFSESVTPEARDAINFLKQHKPDEQFFTASEMTENRLLDILSNFAEHSIWGGGDIRKFKLHRNEVLAEIAQDIANKMGSYMDVIDLGKMVKNIRSHNNDIAKIPATNLYNIVKEESRNLFVKTDTLKAWAKPLAESNKAIQGIGQDLTGLTMAEKAMKFKPTTRVSDMIKLQQAVKAKIRNMEAAVETKHAPAIKTLSDMSKQLDSIIEKGLRQPGTKIELLAAKKEADALWRSAKETFSNDVVNKLISKIADKPSSVIKHIMLSADDGAEELIRSVKATQNPKAWEVVRRGAVEQFYKAATNKDGVMSGKDLLSLMVGKKGMGERAMKELFGKEGTDSLIRFATSLKEIQKRTPISEGKLAIQFAQFGAALAVGAAGFTGTSAAILIGPKLLAKIITNPKGNDLLLRGAAMRKTNPEWPALATRIAGLVSVGEMRKQEEDLNQTMQDLIGGTSALDRASQFPNKP